MVPFATKTLSLHAKKNVKSKKQSANDVNVLLFASLGNSMVIEYTARILA